MKTKDKWLGAGIGLAAIAAAGTYFFYGKRGAKNREDFAALALQLKGEVLERMENLKELDRESYDALVDETASRYVRAKRAGAGELAHVVAELKGSWSRFGAQLKARS